MAILFILMLLVTLLMSGFQTIFAYYMGGRFGLYDAPSPMPLLNGSITLTGPTAMAVLFTIMGIVGVLCQGVLVGYLISKIGESRTVMTGMVVSAAGFILINLSGELVTIMLSSSLIAVGVGLATPCLNSLASKATDEEHQGSTLGVLGSYGALGRIVGAPINGFAFDVNVDLPYLISGLLSAAGALAVYFAIKGKRLRKRV
jgi:MFS family permease